MTDPITQALIDQMRTVHNIARRGVDAKTEARAISARIGMDTRRKLRPDKLSAKISVVNVSEPQLLR